jgi:hypothetical protein
MVTCLTPPHPIPLPNGAGPAHEELREYRELRQTAEMESINGERQALLFAQHFATLPDPRRRLPQHPLLSILFIVLAAQLCGAEGWDAMAAFARAKQEWLASFLELPNTTTRLRFLLSWGSPLVVAAHGPLAMGAVGCVVARLRIVHERERLGQAQGGAWEHDRQQHQGLGQRQRRGFFLA